MGDIKGTDSQYSFGGPRFDFVKILPSAIIQNKGRFLRFGVFVREIQKLNFA